MIEEYNSNNLPIDYNTKLTETEGLIKDLTLEEYQKFTFKCKSVKTLRDFLHKRKVHPEYGIVAVIEAALRLYSGVQEGGEGVRFKGLGLNQQQEELVDLVEEVISFE